MQILFGKKLWSGWSSNIFLAEFLKIFTFVAFNAILKNLERFVIGMPFRGLSAFKSNHLVFYKRTT